MFEILGTIVGAIFSGEYGWKTPVAFVLQVILQIFVASMLGLSTGCAIATGFFLVAVNLLIGFLIGMQVFQGMGGSEKDHSASSFAVSTVVISAVYGGILNAIIIGVAMIWATNAFLPAFLTCVLGATVIHLFGVALPIVQVLKKTEQN